MDPLKTLFYFIRPLFRLKKLNTELAEEVRAHLDLATEANVARGMSPAEARLAAEREFGAPEAAVEQYRDARGVSWFLGWGQDLRHASRSLIRAKWFSFVTVTTLALGIG